MASTSPSTDAAGSLRSLVWLATAATTVTAAWLIGVSIAVLPERDPARILQPGADEEGPLAHPRACLLYTSPSPRD